MLNTSPVTTDQFSQFLARLPPAIDLDALAMKTKALQRKRAVRSGADLLRFALAWGPGGLSLQEAAAWAGMVGFANLTEDALFHRLHNSVGFLEAITHELLSAVQTLPRWPGRHLRLADSTSLSGPASHGTDWRIHAVYDLEIGRFSHLDLTDAHGGEALDRGQPRAGEIRIGDRGFANAQAWQRFSEAAPGAADFIVRMRWNTVRLVDAQGKIFDLTGWLAALPETEPVHDRVVWCQSGRRQTPCPIRLVVQRKSPEALAKSLQDLHRQASRKQQKLDPRSEIAAGFMILATSLPQTGFPAHEILAAYRLRWQIELAFKRLKSLLHIDELRTRTETGTRCWVQAHLVMALLCDDLSQDILDSFPSGAC
jgi:hypothetical protein